jgi:hypothetical protein
MPMPTPDESHMLRLPPWAKINRSLSTNLRPSTQSREITHTHIPLEDIPHLLLTCKYAGATMPKNEIVFRHIFERGLPATREALQACRTYALHAIRKRIGIVLQMDDYGDAITMITKKN